MIRPMPATRRQAAVVAGILAAGLAGCAGVVRIVPVATGQADTPAYELFGPSLAHLKAEALRRCPQGARILRAAEAGERRGAPEAGVVARWLVRGTDVLVPPSGSAQMMVLCQPAAGGDQLVGRSPLGQGTTAGAAPGATEAAALPALAGIELPPPSQAPVSGYP